MPPKEKRTVDVDRLMAKPRQRGRYSDRMRISPFKQGYHQRKGYIPGEGYQDPRKDRRRSVQRARGKAMRRRGTRRA